MWIQIVAEMEDGNLGERGAVGSSGDEALQAGPVQDLVSRLAGTESCLTSLLCNKQYAADQNNRLCKEAQTIVLELENLFLRARRGHMRFFIFPDSFMCQRGRGFFALQCFR